MQCWTLLIVLLAVVAGAIAGGLAGDDWGNQEQELAVTKNLEDVLTTTRNPSILTTSRKPRRTLPTLKPFSPRSVKPFTLEPRTLPTFKPFSPRSVKPFTHEPRTLPTFKPFSPRSVKPFTLEPRTPFTHSSLKPLNLETPKPFAHSSLKPFIRRTPKPISPRTVEPLDLKTPEPFSTTPVPTPIRAIRSVVMDGPGWQLVDSPSSYNVNDAILSGNDDTDIASDEAKLSTIDDHVFFDTTPSGPGWQTMEMDAPLTDMSDLSEDSTVADAYATTALPEDMPTFADDLVTSTDYSSDL